MAGAGRTIKRTETDFRGQGYEKPKMARTQTQGSKKAFPAFCATYIFADGCADQFQCS